MNSPNILYNKNTLSISIPRWPSIPLTPPCFAVLEEGSANTYRPIIAFSPVMAQTLILSALLVALGLAWPWLRHRDAESSKRPAVATSGGNVLYAEDDTPEAVAENGGGVLSEAGAHSGLEEPTAAKRLPNNAAENVCAQWSVQGGSRPAGSYASPGSLSLR